MAMVSNGEAIGATVVSVGWAEVVVRTEDGRLLRIEAGIGHSGVEVSVYETTARREGLTSEGKG